MEESTSSSIEAAMRRWLSVQGVGKKPRTRDFHGEIADIIRQHLPDLTRQPAAVTDDEIASFALAVGHYCPSRWNLIVSILRAIVPAARVLRYRPLRFRAARPPTQLEFRKLLAELDGRRCSQAALVVRLLAQTGLRIAEARQLRWEDVLEDCIHLPAGITKNGRPRAIPLIEGIRQTLERLRAIATGPMVLPQASCKSALTTSCRRAGVRRLTHHDLRHLFATRCIESGVDVPTVARWLGHQDGGALASKMYFHLLDEHSRQMAARVRIGI